MADVFVVTSKVKKLIKEKGGCNTSAETVDVLSKAVERLCEKGVESAKSDGRKTVMARDATRLEPSRSRQQPLTREMPFNDESTRCMLSVRLWADAHVAGPC